MLPPGEEFLVPWYTPRPRKRHWRQVVPEQLLGGLPVAFTGCGSSTLGGSWQQQGVTQGDSSTKVRIVKQLQGCREGSSRVVRGCASLSSAAWRVQGGDCLAQPPGPAKRKGVRLSLRSARQSVEEPGTCRAWHTCVPSPDPTSLHAGPKATWRHLPGFKSSWPPHCFDEEPDSSVHCPRLPKHPSIS